MGRGDEDLFDGRFGGRRAFAENVAVDGDVAGCQELQSRVEYFTFEQVEKRSLCIFFFGQEDESCTITAFLGNGDSLDGGRNIYGYKGSRL